MNTIELVEFKKIVGEGKAMGYLDGRACFVAGPLPGETARVRVRRAAARFIEADLVEWAERSPYRTEAAEAHFGLCSPWQNVAYDYQLELKRGMLSEIMGRPELELAVSEMVPAPLSLGYRNKLEFAVITGSDGKLALAFHERGALDRLVPCPGGCRLGSQAMNAAAEAVLAQLQGLDVATEVVSLMVRQSGGAHGDCVVVIALRRSLERDWVRLLVPELAGVVVAVLRPGHRYEALWRGGQTRLTEVVGGVAVDYAFGGFFQTNIPVFQQALDRMMRSVPQGAAVMDLYGGAGAIGLAVAAQRGGRVMGVEIDAAAVEMANENARRANLTGYTAVATPTEQLDPALFADVGVVIVDPPRAGLDQRVIATLMAVRPERIVYLSCNPVTQARDMIALGGTYRVEMVMGLDFYPGTLHLESLVVLDRRWFD